MPTTFTNLVPVRRVAVGVSASSQGRDGVTELTQTALANLQSLDWTESSEPPFFPVHDYAQNLPRGDAWKACYGYDAAARTERAACGAVVYSFPIPSDALTGAPCDIDAVRFTVVGDRYLDAGVDVYVLPSASATPPTVAAILSGETPAGTYCATGTQTEPPNKRSGVTDEVEVQPGTAATAYVHVALLLHDYVGARGAWIEGGAMLDGPALSITFSRDVAADTPPSTRILLAAADMTYDEGVEGMKLPYASLIMIHPAFPQNAIKTADLATMMQLTYAGRLAETHVEWGFSKVSFDNPVTGASSVLNTTAKSEELDFALYALAYYTPPDGLRVGASIRLPDVHSLSSAGKFRIALVQHDAIAERGTQYPQSTSLSNLPPFDEAFFGEGPNVIAAFSGSVGAGTDQNPTTLSGPSTPVLRSPTKPYLSLVVAPLESKMWINLDNASVLTASPST